MRQTSKDKRIFSAVRDYYNEKGYRVDAIAHHLTGRERWKLTDLTEEEKTAITLIKANMEDKLYMDGLMKA